jgi:murein DD-endopeptidase MepM/ murein hydrolase activator NlpD
MKRLWMTAAAFALCVTAADAWAEPSSPLAASSSDHLLVRVATESSSAHHKKHKHAQTRGKATTKAAASKSRRAKGRHGKRHAAAEERVSGRGHRRHGVSSEIHTAAPAPVKVGRHDTLASISRKTGVPVEELARLNHMKRPYHVILGQRIKLPARRYYVVKSGETLYSLARRFGVETAELAALNGLNEHRHVRSGQRLYLPSGAAEAELAEATPRGGGAPPRSSRPYTTVEPTPYTPPSGQPYVPPSSQPNTPPPATTPAPSAQGFQLAQPSAPAQPPASGPRPLVPAGAAPSAAEVAAAGRGKFVWPVGGSVISGFGPKPDGQKNDGVNVSATTGDPVRAAADGEVVYAGDQVPSFGNLVLIKHAGGWVTAYAHMSRILVKNRDQVTQGQEIGDIGQTGQVASPQLHFEIRYAPSARDKAVPIDPMLVLPAR